MKAFQSKQWEQEEGYVQRALDRLEEADKYLIEKLKYRKRKRLIQGGGYLMKADL